MADDLSAISDEELLRRYMHLPDDIPPDDPQAEALLSEIKRRELDL